MDDVAKLERFLEEADQRVADLNAELHRLTAEARKARIERAVVWDALKKARRSSRPVAPRCGRLPEIVAAYPADEFTPLELAQHAGVRPDLVRTWLTQAVEANGVCDRGDLKMHRVRHGLYAKGLPR